MRVYRRCASTIAITLVAMAMLASTATAARIPVAPVPANPAERLLSLPIEAALYEPAARCLPHARRPGTARQSAAEPCCCLLLYPGVGHRP